jgi:hypothetical protein
MKRKEREHAGDTTAAHPKTLDFSTHLGFSVVTADRGFWSHANKQAAQRAGVERVCIPALGRLRAEQWAEQRQRWFRRGQRFRTGCEGRISVLKRRDGLARCRYRAAWMVSNAGSDGVW